MAVYKTSRTLIENGTGSIKSSPVRILDPYMSCLDNRKISPTPTHGPSFSSTYDSIGMILLLVGSANVRVLSVAALMTEIAETKMMYTSALNRRTLKELIGEYDTIR